MDEHGRYFQEQFEAGRLLLYGPVMATSGAFGRRLKDGREDSFKVVRTGEGDLIELCKEPQNISSSVDAEQRFSVCRQQAAARGPLFWLHGRALMIAVTLIVIATES